MCIFCRSLFVFGHCGVLSDSDYSFGYLQSLLSPCQIDAVVSCCLSRFCPSFLDPLVILLSKPFFIIFLFNLLTMRVPEEDYSRNELFSLS